MCLLVSLCINDHIVLWGKEGQGPVVSTYYDIVHTYIRILESFGAN